MELRVKVSGAGWLCVKDENKWLSMFQLTDEQLNEWKWFEFYRCKQDKPEVARLPGSANGDGK